MTLMSGPELIVFDCDGVLVDSAEITGRILAGALADLGLPMAPTEAGRRFLGPPLPQVVADIESQVGRDLGREWMMDFEATRAAAFREELHPMPGAVEAVAEIVAAGIAICVASQARLDITGLKLEVTGLARLFPSASLFSTEQVPRGKPWPDLFLYAAGEMGAEPRRCAVVEDTLGGVAAAVAAGMRPFGLCPRGDTDDMVTAGAEPLTSMWELPSRVAVF